MDIEAVSESGYEKWSNSSTPTSQQEPLFHTAIFYPSSSEGYSLTTTPRLILTPLDQKVNSFVSSSSCAGIQMVPTSNVEGSVRADVELSWGGKDGPTCDASVKGEAHDNKGNHVEVTVHQNSKGEGGVSSSGGHDPKDKNSEKDHKSK